MSESKSGEWISVEGNDASKIGELFCVNKRNDYLFGYLIDAGDEYQCESDAALMYDVTHFMIPKPPEPGQ